MFYQVNGYLTNRICTEQTLIYVLLYAVVGQNVPPTVDEFPNSICNGSNTVYRQNPEPIRQQLSFPCQGASSYQDSEPVPVLIPQTTMIPEPLQQQPETQQPMAQLETRKGCEVDFASIRMFPEQNGNGFINTSTSTCQSLNLISQMSESELLGIINPSTFDSV